MSKDIQKLGGMTDLVAVANTSAAKALSVTNSLYLIVENIDTSNPVFVTSGILTDTITFPTTSTGQRGAYLKPSSGQLLYKKNNPNDTHIITISTATSAVANLVVQSAEGM